MMGDISVIQPLEVPTKGACPVPIAVSLEDETATKSTQRRKISTMTSPRMRNDIDYEIFPIEHTRYCAANKIYPPSDRATTDFTKVEGVAETLAERPVWVATGTTGTIRGVIQTSTHFIKMADGQTFQEMWAVHLERRAGKGFPFKALNLYRRRSLIVQSSLWGLWFLGRGYPDWQALRPCSS
jgi:hypothetical protein